MPNTPNVLNRRRLLALTALAAAVVPFTSQRPATAQTPTATPARLPADIPVTVSPNASPEFITLVNGVRENMSKRDVPGIAIGAYRDGLTEIATLGHEDLSTLRPLTTNTRFSGEAVSKVVTATAAMRLVEAGMLQLDAPVRTYLPDLTLADASVAGHATPRHLLTHTSNWWGDTYTDTGGDEDALARFVRDKMPSLPQLAPLGSFYSYNNTGFTLLGRVIEVLTGQSYRAAMQSLVFDPLGLDNSTFDPATILAASHAIAHRGSLQGTKVVSSLFLPRNLDPAGGLFTTITDLLTFARFHVGDGTARSGRVLKRETLDVMQASGGGPIPLPFTQDVFVGLPWIGITDGALALVSDLNDQQTFGQYASITLVPYARTAIVVYTNAGHGYAAFGLGTNASLSSFLNARPPVGTTTSGQPTRPAPTPMPTQLPVPTALPVPTPTRSPGTPASSPTPSATPGPAMDKFAEYIGVYRTPNRIITISQDGDRLVINARSDAVPDQVQDAVTLLNEVDAPNKTLPIQFGYTDDQMNYASDMMSVPLFFYTLRRPDRTIGYLYVNGRLYPKQ